MGVYLTGSLSYGDFNPESSDIDLLVLLRKPAAQEKLEALKQMHLHIKRNKKKWAKRVECSYVSLDMLQEILPPKTPRPYIGEGIFYFEAPYGNEWIIIRGARTVFDYKTLLPQLIGIIISDLIRRSGTNSRPAF